MELTWRKVAAKRVEKASAKSQAPYIKIRITQHCKWGLSPLQTSAVKQSNASIAVFIMEQFKFDLKMCQETWCIFVLDVLWGLHKST